MIMTPAAGRAAGRQGGRAHDRGANDRGRGGRAGRGGDGGVPTEFAGGRGGRFLGRGGGGRRRGGGGDAGTAGGGPTPRGRGRGGRGGPRDIRHHDVPDEAHDHGAAGRGDGVLIIAGRGGRGRGRGRGGRGGGAPPDPAAAEEVVLLPAIFEGIFPGGAPENNNDPLLVVVPPPFVFPRCPMCDQARLLPAAHGDLIITSADDMLKFGLGLMGWEPVGHGLTNGTRFKAHYGIDSKGLFALYHDLKEQGGDRTTDPRTLLMAMNFLRCYETEPCMASRWRLKEATVRVKVREYVRRIQQLKQNKIVWGGFGDEVHIITVDGVHCRIEEPRVYNPGSAHYSHKFNGAGVSYELGISIYSSRLVWIAGPFPASRHDLTIFRGGKPGEDWDPNALFFTIPAGKKAIADSAYAAEAGVDGKIVISRPEDPPDLQRFKARAKARHETFNARLKSFRVLDVPYRGLRLQHASAFEASCVAVQYAMENGHPLFDMLHAVDADADEDEEQEAE